VSDVVVDSSALLAMVFSESGGATVKSAFGPESRVLISAVNLSEVVARLLDVDYGDEDLQEVLDYSGLETVPLTRELAVAAGRLRPSTRHLGLSTGDRACLALAAAEGLAVLTADRAWAQLDVGIDIRLIR
jgi:PIN domain nuclease of toxin-antitoxin system